MSKICNGCGRNVDDNANFCPYCKCNTFTNANVPAPQNDDLVHKLLYWSYPEGSVLSKTKLATIVVLIYCIPFCVMVSSSAAGIIVALIFAVITLLVGLVGHKIKGEPSPDRLKYNDYGLAKDLKHLFFFWQERNGGFVLSKTKIISFAIFLLGFALGLLSLNNLVLFGAIFFGVLFEIPVFAVGTVIHKLTNDGSEATPELPKRPKNEIRQTPKVETKIQIPKPQIIPEYLDYQLQLDELNKKFIAKEKSAHDLIAKRFEPPQLTYTRFITGVDKSSQLFKKHRDSAYTMISLADEYSSRIASEVEAKIAILEEITDKIDSLSNELIVNDSITTKEDVDDLIGEMDDLIKSVKDYDA